MPAWAAPLAELQNLLASDAAGEINEFFGIDIALSGDTAVVGAYNDNNANGNRAGAAYVFTRDLMGTWSEEAKRRAAEGVAGNDCGHKRPS